MADEFCHRALRGVVAQLCHSLGWHSIHSSSCDVLAELTSRYMLTVARTSTSYSTHANRASPNLLDLEMAFHDLNISIPQLLEYAQEVNAGQLPQTVSRFPTPKPQSHLYTGPGAKIKRRSAKVTSVQLQSQGEEGDEMGSEGEEEESETEEIPGYLPPLPKTQEDSENGDAESGIGEGVADPVTTPTTVKSPPNPNAGLPTYYRQLTHSVSEEEGGGGSRRSSISEGTPSNGHSLLPSQDVPVFGAPDGSLPISITKATHSDTAHSTPEPAYLSTSAVPEAAAAKMEIVPPVSASKDPSHGHDVAAEKMTPTPTPSPSPSPSPSPTPSPLPSPPKSVPVNRALSPSVPIKPEARKEVKYATTPHDEAKEKAAKEFHITASDNSSKVAASFLPPPPVPTSLPFPRYTKRPPPPLQPPATPPRMPQLHRMSPITPSSPPSSSPLHLRAAPTLSPLTNTAPYSFMTPNPPLRPVLHRLGRTLSDPPRGELTRRPSDTSMGSPVLPPPRTAGSDPGGETAPVYAPQLVKKFEPEKDAEEEEQKSPADVEIYLSPSPVNSESSASLSTSLSHESSPVKPSSPVRPASQTGFILATDTVLSPSSPILHSPTTSLSSSTSFSSSSLSPPQTKSTFEPEYPEVSKDVHEPFMQSLPEPTLSESSNESDSDSSVDHTEYPPIGGLGKGIQPESKHIREYPDVHKGAQLYPDHPLLERKQSFSPSSESSVESVPKQPLKVSISRLKIDGQTSYAVQPSPSQPPKLQPTHISPTGDPGTSGLQVSSSSYQKVRSIRPPPPTRTGLTVSMKTTKVTTPRLEPPPTSLVVSIFLRNLHTGKFCLTPSSPVSEESVKVTIPKSIFMSDKRVKKTMTGSRKRERETEESEHKIIKEPKKVKIAHHPPPPPPPPPPPRPVSPSSSSSSSSSDSSSDDSSSDSDDNSVSSSSPQPPPLLNVSRPQQFRRSQTHSSDDALSGSSDSSSLRLKLKVGQQPVPPSETGLRQKRQQVPMPPSRPKSKKPLKSHPSSSSGLMIHSSTPIAGNVFGKKKKKVKQKQPSQTITLTSSKKKLVPHLTLTKIPTLLPVPPPPPLASTSGGGEVYICPTCGHQDDGTPMIACDKCKCDIWYHIQCVGLMCVPPGDEKWFCPNCVKKKKTKKRRPHN